MILKIELPIDCELYVNSYDLDDLVKVIKPVQVLGILTDEELKDDENNSSIARIDFRVKPAKPF